MSEQRCDLTELLIEHCACPRHRGGEVVHPDEVETVGWPFEARYAGVCVRCERVFRRGRMILATADGGHVHQDCLR